MPEIGDPAPDFTLESSDGGTVTLGDLRGQRVVLYFYPADDTPGCTTQACAIRDAWGDILATGARLYGISPDPVGSHERFIAKFGLPFPLLADTERAAAEAYGTWVEKRRNGKTSMDVERSTFVIGEDGRIAAVWRRVKPADHVALVLGALRA